MAKINDNSGSGMHGSGNGAQGCGESSGGIQRDPDTITAGSDLGSGETALGGKPLYKRSKRKQPEATGEESLLPVTLDKESVAQAIEAQTDVIDREFVYEQICEFRHLSPLGADGQPGNLSASCEKAAQAAFENGAALLSGDFSNPDDGDRARRGETAGTESILDAALACAAQGFYVFPCHAPIDVIKDSVRCSCGKPGCKSPGKHPYIPRGCNGASLDDQLIRRWWPRGAFDFNLAIATEPSRLVVVDIDPPYGDRSWEELGIEIHTATVTTGSGGRHLYFRAPAGVRIQSSQNVLGRGIDVKAAGGYVIAPPSRHLDGGVYSWNFDAPIAELPPALLERLQKRNNSQSRSSTAKSYSDASIDEVKAALKFIPPEERETWLKAGMALHHGFGEEGYSAWAEWSQGSDKYDEADQLNTWGGFSAAGNGTGVITLRTLFALAHEGGYRAEDARDTETALRIIDVNDLVTLELPVREFTLAPILREREALMIYSWRGTGKTLLGLLMAYALATGGQCLRWSAPKARRVLYIDGELPLQMLQERMTMLIKAYAAVPDPGHLRFLAHDAQELMLPDLGDPEGQDALWPLVKEADVVIFDSLSTLMRRAKENEAEGWQPMQDFLLRLRRAGKNCVLIHHAGKSGEQRGTSKREDILDAVIELKLPPDHSPADGARFEVHLKKCRAIFGDAVKSFGAGLNEGGTWATYDIENTNLARAAELFGLRMSVRDVAEELKISKSSAHRLKRELDQVSHLPHP
jgi:hypothetical protein